MRIANVVDDILLSSVHVCVHDLHILNLYFPCLYIFIYNTSPVHIPTTMLLHLNRGIEPLLPLQKSLLRVLVS